MSKSSPIKEYNLHKGRKIGPHYSVEQLLGKGVEGEVYQVTEVATGIHRACKIFYPQRNHQRAMSRQAQKLHQLRSCPVVLHYHHIEQILINRTRVSCVISELCEGEPLAAFINRFPGKRLHYCIALHLLYDLVLGLESIHASGEYHGDVHTNNIMIQPKGVRYQLKIIDFYDWGKCTRTKQQQDIYDAIRLVYESIGGIKQYQKQLPEMKYILGAGRQDIIIRRFPTISALRNHLENFEWSI